MNFNGRWVPLEVMDTIILLWAMVAIALTLVLVRVARRRSGKKPQHEGKPLRHGRKKHGARRKP